MGKAIPDRIRREIEAEFPEDYALQQVHIARRLLAEQARKAGGLSKLLEARTRKRAASAEPVSSPKA